MSASVPDNFDLEEQRAQINRAYEETRKFVAEQHKLAAEQNKLSAEQLKLAAEQAKLYAEADKLRRDHILAPVLAAAAVSGAVAALVTLLLRGVTPPLGG